MKATQPKVKCRRAWKRRRQSAGIQRYKKASTEQESSRQTRMPARIHKIEVLKEGSLRAYKEPPTKCFQGSAYLQEAVKMSREGQGRGGMGKASQEEGCLPEEDEPNVVLSHGRPAKRHKKRVAMYKGKGTYRERRCHVTSPYSTEGHRGCPSLPRSAR